MINYHDRLTLRHHVMFYLTNYHESYFLNKTYIALIMRNMFRNYDILKTPCSYLKSARTAQFPSIKRPIDSGQWVAHHFAYKLSAVAFHGIH